MSLFPPVRVVSGFGGGRPLKNASSPWTVVKKKADQTINNNATLFSDTDLRFSVSAGTSYQIRAKLWASAHGAADFMSSFTGPAVPTLCQAICLGWPNTNVNNPFLTPDNITFGNVYPAAGQIVQCSLNGMSVMEWSILYIPSASGTFAFQWAQGTLSANFTTLKKLSYLEYLALS